MKNAFESYASTPVIADADHLRRFLEEYGPIIVSDYSRTHADREDAEFEAKDENGRWRPCGVVEKALLEGLPYVRTYLNSGARQWRLAHARDDSGDSVGGRFYGTPEAIQEAKDKVETFYEKLMARAKNVGSL